MRPRTIERIENGLIVVFAMTGTIVIAPAQWWFPLAAFLAFDLSILGYVRSPATGAVWYNAVHTHAWSAVLGVIALVTSTSSPMLSKWLALVAFAWAVHVGVDRMLGYGLKLPDAFTHTHLGWIGKNHDKGERVRTGS
ncbi:DUF4260 family protein [Jiangella endophytica]|uniref:DUF4260 family protein n=1 Tax=Jiangella endophytica TaxID=1623398 RepID=UPI000E352C7C|nr:DUF4260 family protein [Jiangella endophytica]